MVLVARHSNCGHGVGWNAAAEFGPDHSSGRCCPGGSLGPQHAGRVGRRRRAQDVHAQQNRQLHLASLHERICGRLDREGKDIRAEVSGYVDVDDQDSGVGNLCPVDCP